MVEKANGPDSVEGAEERAFCLTVRRGGGSSETVRAKDINLAIDRLAVILVTTAKAERHPCPVPRSPTLMLSVWSPAWYASLRLVP